MLDYNADGTVTAHLLDGDVVLRRPSIGEYRTLRESIQKLGAIHDELVRTCQAENDAYRAELIGRPDDFDVEEWAAKEEHARDNLRRVSDSADELRLSWLHEVYELLVGSPVEDERLPSTVVDARWPVLLQEHWRSVPLVRGGQ